MLNLENGASGKPGWCELLKSSPFIIPNFIAAWRQIPECQQQGAKMKDTQEKKRR
jgi:hypothetical protein